MKKERETMKKERETMKKERETKIYIERQIQKMRERERDKKYVEKITDPTRSGSKLRIRLDPDQNCGSN